MIGTSPRRKTLLQNRDFVKSFLKCGALASCGEKKVLAGWGKRQTSELRNEKPSFYFPDYFLSKKEPWINYQNSLEFAIDELVDIFESAKHPHPSCLQWKDPYPSLFPQAFENLKEQFAKGTLTKGVPFIVEVAEGTMDPARLGHSLMSVLNAAKKNQVYLYGFWDHDEGILGATPEYLFQLEKDGHSSIAKILACGGTCAQEEGAFLTQDPKQLYEHQLIIEGIRESVSHLGNVTQGNLELLKLPTLCHLVTPLNVKLDSSIGFSSLVHALHPTPAVGAFPKKEGMEWLKDYQAKIDRSYFGAPVGYMRKEEGRCYVAIRNVQWSKGSLRIAAGCGIVPQSEVTLEWKELQLKMQSIKKMLAL